MADEDALLTDAEIVTITGKQRHKAQSKALRAMGIRHFVRPDGKVLVARALIRSMLGRYTETAPAPANDAHVLNLAALRPRRQKRG